MSFQEIKTDGYCVGGSHRSATTKVYCDITSKGSKVLIGFCSACHRKKSMTVSNIPIQAEGLGSFFKDLVRISAKAGKKKPTKKALDVGANVATAAVSRNPKNVLSTITEVLTFTI